MNVRNLVFAGMILSMQLACDQKPAQESEMPPKEETASEMPIQKDTMMIVSTIDSLRQAIEEGVSESEAMEIATDSLRAKVRQKWSRIDYYTLGSKVVRVQTFPYEDISSRTEEFYFDDGELILAVIQDNGTAEEGEADPEIDKMYYYDGGEFLYEINQSGEEEFSIRKSESEELLQEAREYLDIYEEK